MARETPVLVSVLYVLCYVSVDETLRSAASRYFMRKDRLIVSWPMSLFPLITFKHMPDSLETWYDGHVTEVTHVCTCVSSEVSTMATVHIVTPCGLLGGFQCSRRKCCLLLQC
jgi:hypothetical protein